MSLQPLETLHINIDLSYPIYIGDSESLKAKLKPMCQQLATKWVIITDDTVKSLYAEALCDYLHSENIPHLLLSVPPGECSKTREVKAQLEDKMLAQNLAKDTGIIALGGGVISDLAGFIGATYMRAIPCIYMPSTLLAMVDASIGGKTAVNTPFGKNLIGTFSQPEAVLINPGMLQTLPYHELRQGFAEMIKHALIADYTHFETLFTQYTKLKALDYATLTPTILTSISIKQKIVEKDPLEKGLRQVLNFGHTIGHAIEAASEYTITHGDAVAMGIMIESHLSHLQGFLGSAALCKIQQILDDYGLPTELYVSLKDIKRFLARDKKSQNQHPHFVMLKGIGQYVSEHNRYSFVVDEKHIDEAMSSILIKADF